MTSKNFRTTHVGSLPRSMSVTEAIFARENVSVDGMTISDTAKNMSDTDFTNLVHEATHDIVQKQKTIGISIPSDGEMSKVSYATYIKDRLTGFAGDSPRRPPSDLADFPGYMEKIARSGGTPTYHRPQCVSDVQVKTLAPLHADIDRFRSALNAAGYTHEANEAGARHPSGDEAMHPSGDKTDNPKSDAARSNSDAVGFMNAASPGVIALFLPTTHYPTNEAYLDALAEAMRVEYEAIVDAGFMLQIDCPDLALGRHMAFGEASEEEFLKRAELHVEALNHALRNVDPQRVRLHVCWGNYEGPHHHDIPLRTILKTVLKARARHLLLEGANPRHGHEWTVWKDIPLPEDWILYPGVIDSTTNFIEHPELVAERILRYAGVLGAERVVASTDCGFATFAGFGAVDAGIVWHKLTALVEGAALASKRLSAS